MVLISEFDFEIKHIKGKENRVEDALSRSMETIHLEEIIMYVFDINQRIRNSLQDDEHIKSIK